MKFKYLVFTFLCGCILGGAYHERVIGKYYLDANDVYSDMILTYQRTSDINSNHGLILPTVFSVGYNSKYIIAKQHPNFFYYHKTAKSGGMNYDTAITNYFIVRLFDQDKDPPDSNTMGPFSLEEFNKKRKELNIPESLTFTKEIKELK